MIDADAGVRPVQRVALAAAAERARVLLDPSTKSAPTALTMATWP